jgi:IS30 family transposase
MAAVCPTAMIFVPSDGGTRRSTCLSPPCWKVSGRCGWDRGSEVAEHKRFSLATDVKVYFCDPQQPWQRGSNENTNGLLRQYFPKGMDLSGINQNRLNAVARRLNERPRETLNFETPAERFSQCVASIG